MFTRQIPLCQYNSFQRSLDTHIPRAPMDITYHCDLNVNGTLYRLHLHLGSPCVLLPIQAIRMDPDPQKCRLITDPPLLGALTELLLAQYSSDKLS